MISEDILKKIRRIEIISRKSSKEVFAGEYHSAFKGRGMEFSEVREYIPGDDIRFIDWNVSSRMGKLFVKQFVEERELTVILAIDLSASLDFFSKTKSKKEIAAEISAIIAFTAMLNNDKVGLLLFTGEIERFIPPKKGRSHLLRLISEILSFTAKGKGTSVNEGLEYLNRVIKKKAIVFLISDFIDENFEQAIKISSSKHDLIAIKVTDEKEETLPPAGIFMLKDPENDDHFFVNFSSRKLRRRFQEKKESRQLYLERLFKRYSIDHINISKEKNYEKALFDFFLERKKKYSR